MVQNVERIIVRDFFPDHDQLKDQKEYLEAEERKDFEKMRQIALKYAAAGGSQGSTPATLSKKVFKEYIYIDLSCFWRHNCVFNFYNSWAAGFFENWFLQPFSFLWLPYLQSKCTV